MTIHVSVHLDEIEIMVAVYNDRHMRELVEKGIFTFGEAALNEAVVAISAFAKWLEKIQLVEAGFDENNQPPLHSGLGESSHHSL